MKSSFWAAALCGLGATLASSGTVESQQITPTFRAEARLVEVDAVVHGEDGRFIGDLGSHEFEILEDDRPQVIDSVSVLNLPLPTSPGLTADSHSSATSPAVRDTPPASLGRMYVMILDSGELERVRSIATRFIHEHLGPADLMAVVEPGLESRAQPLTNDKALLLAAVNRYRGTRMASRLASFRSLRDMAINLNAATGRRKAILFLGIGMNMWGAIPSLHERWREYNEAARAATRNNVRIYPVDTRGFRADGIESAAADTQSSLRLMAEDTGGIAVVNTNNYGSQFQRIVQDNSAYYLLTYYSSAPRDGTYHRITVRVTRPGLSVRARRGYAAPRLEVKGRAVSLPRDLSPAARAVLRGEAASGGFPLSVTTTVFQDDRSRGSVLVDAHIGGRYLRSNPKDRIEFSYAAVDLWGTIRAVERRAFSLNLSEQTRATVQRGGLRLFGRLTVPQGRYQIRVAASQPDGVILAGVVAEVEVPDFSDAALSISEFVVFSRTGAAAAVLEDDPVLRGGFFKAGENPTARRTFTTDEAPSFYAEIYDSHWLLSREIGITTVLRAESGEIVRRTEDSMASANRGRFAYAGRLRLVGLPAGKYAVTVEAHTRFGVPASASRQLWFEIVTGTRDN